MAIGGASGTFVDTNVLVYAAIAEAPEHQAARQALRAQLDAGRHLWISRQVLREFVVTLTRPQSFSPQVAFTVLRPVVRQLERDLLVADDTAEVTRQLLGLLAEIPTGGRQVHDANIVATMQVHGVQRLLTANPQDFIRFSHLVEVQPLATTQ